MTIPLCWSLRKDEMLLEKCFLLLLYILTNAFDFCSTNMLLFFKNCISSSHCLKSPWILGELKLYLKKKINKITLIYNSIQVSRVQYYISTPVNVQHAHHQKSQFPPTTIQLTPFTYFTPTSSLLITILFSVSTCLLFFVLVSSHLFFFFSTHFT